MGSEFSASRDHDPAAGAAHIEARPEREPLYEARGLSVWKRRQERLVGGRKHISMGFKVCTVSEWLDEEGAKYIAEMLDFAERATLADGALPRQDDAQQNNGNSTENGRP